MSTAEAAANAARKVMTQLKIVGPHDKVYKSECIYSFDSPETPGGLYLNVATRCAVSERYLVTDRKKTGGVFYIHQIWRRVPKKAEPVPEQTAAPVILAIGVPGGFAADAVPFEVEKTNTLVVFLAAADDVASRFTIPFPSVDASNALPTFCINVAQALLDKDDGAVIDAAAAWTGVDKPTPSKYAAALVQAPSEGKMISPNPADWVCDVPNCGKTENLWLNLGDGFIGCGRRYADGTGGNGHALAHFRDSASAYPLCVKLGTITAGGADVYSYARDEDDAKEDPHLARHLAHWGINIMQLTKTEKSVAEMDVDLNAKYDWSRISEAGRDLVAVTGPGLIGLDNLGNTCYINSSLQLLACIPELAGTPGPVGTVGGYGDPALSTRIFESVAGGPGGVADDLLAQTAKLMAGLGGGRYAASKAALSAESATGIGKAGAQAAVEASLTDDNAVALADAGTCSADASSLTHTHTSGGQNGSMGIPPGPGASCGFVSPRMYRSLVGRGHPDFSSSAQQDAPAFMEWLLSLYDRAHGSCKPGSGRGATLSGSLPPCPSDLLSFQVECRLACEQSGLVRYSKGTERYLRLRVPLEAALNKGEVDAARAAAEARASAQEQQVGEREGKRARHTLTGPGGHPLPRYVVPFAACLRSYAAPSQLEGWLSPATGHKGRASTTLKLATSPPYLLIVLSRYELAADWTTRKVDAEVVLPLDLDLSAFQWDGDGAGLTSLLAPTPGGAQPGEGILPVSAPNNAQTGAPPPSLEPDAALVAQLLDFGFPAGAASRAALAVLNAGVEPAMEWLLTHSEDPGFDAPYVPTPARGAMPTAQDPASVSMLGDMGFGPKSSSAALAACGGDLERAAEWLFSRAGTGELEALEAGDTSGGGAFVDPQPQAGASSGVYTLLGFASHMGSSPASGHYVAHVRKDAQGRSPAHAEMDAGSLRWHIFNDSKVALSEDPPLEQGYMYLYARK